MTRGGVPVKPRLISEAACQAVSEPRTVVSAFAPFPLWIPLEHANQVHDNEALTKEV